MNSDYRIGVLGGGQLGRMLALAGYPLGIWFRFLDTSASAPAGQMAELITASFDDGEILRRFAAGCNVVTYEFENVPVQAARVLSEMVRVSPPPRALEVSQDRFIEKTFLDQIGVSVPSFRPVDSLDDLKKALATIGYPAVIKTRRMGYDGKGQIVIGDPQGVTKAWDALSGNPLIIEQHIKFDREVSIIAVRSLIGDVAFYPIVENHHRAGILRLSIPVEDSPDEMSLQLQAQEIATKVLHTLDYVGVLAIEFFVVNGHLMANEIAPRVHNSGHWTIEGAQTSQFENHVRAISGLPLGSTAKIGYSAMVNLIGSIPAREDVLEIPCAHLHLYGKNARPGRKLGHVTVCASSPQERADALRRVSKLPGVELLSPAE